MMQDKKVWLSASLQVRGDQLLYEVLGTCAEEVLNSEDIIIIIHLPPILVHILFYMQYEQTLVQVNYPPQV